MPKGSSSKPGTNKANSPAKGLTKHDSDQPPNQPDDNADSLQAQAASRPTRAAKQHLLDNPTWERRRNASGKKRRNSSDSMQGDPGDQVSAKKQKTDSEQKQTRSTAFRAPKLTVDSESADSASDDGGQFPETEKQNLRRTKAHAAHNKYGIDEDEVDTINQNAHKKRHKDSDEETGSSDEDTSGSETEESDRGEFASMSQTARAAEIPTWTDNSEQWEVDKDDSRKEKAKRKRTHQGPPDSSSDDDHPADLQPRKDKAKTKQVGRRRGEERAWEKRAAEEPIWNEVNEDQSEHGREREAKGRKGSAHKTSAPKPDPDSDRTDDDDDHNIELVYPPTGRKWSELPITTQHPQVRKVADLANLKVHIAILTEEAFTDGTTAQTCYARKALLNSAKELGDTDIYTRIKNDKQYGHDLGTIPAQRISTYRGPVKKAAAKVVEGSYGLKAGCAQKVQWLLQSCHYVFPCDVEKLKHDGSKPYRNEAIISVLRNEYFTGEPSFAQKNPELFKSSLPEKPHELELLRAMVALAGTAVGSCLRDWESGVPPTKWSDFRGDGNLTLYNANIKTIDRIKANSLAKYHKMMHDLYVILTNSKVPVLNAEDDEDAVDYDAMSE